MTHRGPFQPLTFCDNWLVGSWTTAGIPDEEQWVCTQAQTCYPPLSEMQLDFYISKICKISSAISLFYHCYAGNKIFKILALPVMQNCKN